MHCKTKAIDAYWVLNNESISIHGARSKYEELGFMFRSSDDSQQGYFNLTLTVLATEQINNTKVECEAISSNHIDVAYSNMSHIVVFTTFRKLVLNFVQYCD